MRALVISDSHGDAQSVNTALRTVNNADVVIFLGDGERDMYTPENSVLLQNKHFVAVRGNCDFYSNLPDEEIIQFGTKKIYALHGHTKGVKHGFASLENAAEMKGVQIVVHGHTHEERVNYERGIHYMCPGSIRDGHYGIIDLDEKSDTVLCYVNSIYKR